VVFIVGNGRALPASATDGGASTCKQSSVAIAPWHTGCSWLSVHLGTENQTVFRITSLLDQDSPHGLTLRCEGRLTAACLGEFAGACEPLLGRGRRFGLDLAGITFVDEAGIGAIRDVVARGVEVRGSSLFVTALLKEIIP
jgi:hypothetical protein